MSIYDSFDNLRILVTGGAGFIGGALIRRILRNTNALVFNLDKIGYASNLIGIDSEFQNNKSILRNRYKLLKVDLNDSFATVKAIKESNPDLIVHLAAESHVDRSIESPHIFIENNIIGTMNILNSCYFHWKSLSNSRKEIFRFHHVSTDEVFGTLGKYGKFTENHLYQPRSPYAASKAASDHLVRAWFHTYGLPVVLSNSSNTYGPWQFPEKLIPLSILKAVQGLKIPIYGNGMNMRDWIFIEDHVDALMLVASRGDIGETYCIGSGSEITNIELIENVCKYLDANIGREITFKKLISFVDDRPGHDYRYSNDTTKIRNQLKWRQKHSLQEGLEFTVKWYLKNIDWCKKISKDSNYSGNRIGLKFTSN